MENQNIPQQPISAVSPVPPTQPTNPIISPPPPSSPTPFIKSKKMFVLISILLLLCIVGSSFYFLGAKKTTPPTKELSVASPTPTAIVSPTVQLPTPTVVTQKINPLPSDWTVKNSSICNVGIPLPPKIEPYYIPENPNTPPAVDDEGGYWQFEEYNTGMFMFTTTARVIFRHPEAGSGYVSGDVEIICSPNASNYTTQTLMAKLESDLNSGEIKIKSKNSTTVWGKEVNIVKFQGGMFNDNDYYIFATPKNLYLIRKIAMSTNQTIKNTTDQIFNNLQFLN